MTIGIIGLGSMGRPVAKRLALAGFDVGIYDVNEEAVKKLTHEVSVRGFPSSESLGQSCDIVIALLPNGRIVRSVMLGEQGQSGNNDSSTAVGLVNAMAPGSVFIDMGSSDPRETQALGKVLARGIDMLDAPVSGGVRRAEAGTLTIMVGGAVECYQRALPVLEVLGNNIFYTGPLGSAHALKALNNLVSAAGLIAAAEALVIGACFGLSPVTMIDVINNSTGVNNSTQNKFKQFILSRTFASGFSLDLMLKDISTAVDLAQDLGVPAPFAALCRELCAAAKTSLPQTADHTEVVKWFEGLAKIELSLL